MNSLFPQQAAILQADARVIPLQDQSVHCVVTSPPYWGLRDYGTAKWEGGDAGCRHVREDVAGPGSSGLEGGKGNIHGAYGASYRDTCKKCGAHRVDAQLGLEATPDEYLDGMVAVFREVWRVLRDDGSCWVNMGDCYNNFRVSQNGQSIHKHELRSKPPGRRKVDIHLKEKDLVGMPWRLAFALQADGWYLRSDIIWSKPNPMPESVTDRPTKSHEYMFLLTKRPRYFYDADAVREDGANSRHWGTRERVGQYDGTGYNNRGGALGIAAIDSPSAGRNLRDVWHIATQPYPEAHFATYPEKLVEPCVKAGTSQRGVCATCGAGWVRVVEKNYRSAMVAGEHLEEPDTWKGSRSRPRKRASDGTFLPRTDDARIPTSRQYGTGGAVKRMGDGIDIHTTGWRPACECNAPTVPAIVFDPFGGSGTTASVALKLGRRAVVMDIGYHELSKRRVFK